MTATWPVLVVDDDPSVLRLIALIVSQESLDGRPVEVLSASSAGEAQRLLEERPDIAVAVVDVVMESEDAGLVLARWIRNQPELSAVRVVLHTGQPGGSREEDIRASVDIDDYWSKGRLRTPDLKRRLRAQLAEHDSSRQGRPAVDTGLRSFAYTSRYLGKELDRDLAAIAASASRFNPRHHITGVLVSWSGRFLQLIEGPPRDVADLLMRIVRDPRHGELETLADGPVPHRALPDWTMRVISVDLAEGSPLVAELDELIQAAQAGAPFDTARLATLLAEHVRAPD